MANIRPNQLPPATTITNNDRLIIDQGAAGVNAAPPKSLIDTFAPVATQSDAEDGTDNVKRMTPLRAQQHLLAQGVPNTRSVIAGDGLAGGGTLDANLELALSSTSLASLALADSAVQSVNGKSGSSVALTKADVGLSNVDNTSDANKPISTATQTALNAKANSAVTITAGSGLTGGGNLTANRTIALNSDSIASLGKADTALQAPGGTAGQVLAKNSADDNDVSWVTSEAATAVSYGPQTLTEAQQGQARGNIGAQQSDPSLDALAGLTGAADTMPYFTGPGTMGQTGLTAFARSLLDDANAEAMRSTLELTDANIQSRVLNSFGNYGPPSSVNINNLNAGDAGLYSQSNTGAPIGAAWWWIETQRLYNTSGVLQIATAYYSSTVGEPIIAIRTRSGTDLWSEWRYLTSQRGSNSNGNYVRFADGTQICTISGFTISYENSSTLRNTWTFPSTFISPPVSTFSPTAFLPPDFREVSQRSVTTVTTASLYIVQNGTWPTGTSTTVDAMAIGRWF